METVFGFFIALIFFYVLLEWRLGRARRESEQRYADLEAKTRWLYERLQELLTRPATETPPAEAVQAGSEASVAPAAEAIAVSRGLTLPEEAAAAPPSAEPPAAKEPGWLSKLLFGGNILAKIGVVLLIFGVGSALKLAAEFGVLPAEARLGIAALFGVALGVLGWRKRANFSDPEWDGEPLEPDPSGPRPPPGPPGPVPPHPPPPSPPPRPLPIKVKLADGKERKIQHMTATTFWSADGRPMSAAQFLEVLYGTLPEFFKDEDELRRIWSAPDTRKALLAGLADKGFGREPLAEMQKIIEAEKSDLFDVLAYVAFAAEPVTRAERAAAAHAAAATEFTERQQAFVDFVLAQYVRLGVDELDSDKLPPLLKLKYGNALSDAFKDLGKPEQVRRVFAGFQKYLYTPNNPERVNEARS